MILFPIPRATQRAQLDLQSSNYLPFKGSDIWYAYELSWLNQQGKPEIAMGRITVPCESPYLIESKSLKLYFNSHNNVVHATPEVLAATVKKDLSEAAQADVVFDLLMPKDFDQCRFVELPGECIDGLEVETDLYKVNREFLWIASKPTASRNDKKTLHSHLLKSNCPATGLPDWGSVVIDYEGPALDKAGLLKYIISYREHGEFHEHCVERIFMDLMKIAQPEKLTVYARYTRRGGIDINPIRTTEAQAPDFGWTRTFRS